jgi:pimeloyl-ACP methyl ester carboxylesterase
LKSHQYQARDGITLAYRWFPRADSEQNGMGTVLICLHGATMNNLRYVTLARTCQAKGISVCLPDWRGHGESEGKAGDLDYRQQLQDDLADLLNHLRQAGAEKLIIGGHSAGSLIALGYIGDHGCDAIDGFFAIAPPLSKTEETCRYDYPGAGMQYLARYWRKKRYQRPLSEEAARYLPKINFVRYWLATWMPFFRHQVVMHFPTMGPSNIPNDHRVYDYTYMLISAYSHTRYPELLSKITVPCRFIVGEFDEIVEPDLVHHLRAWYIHPELDSDSQVIARSQHMSVIMPAGHVLSAWLTRWNTQQEAA